MCMIVITDYEKTKKWINEQKKMKTDINWKLQDTNLYF